MNGNNKQAAATTVRALAEQYEVAYVTTSTDVWAQNVTRLAGDDVKLDELELLLIALQRSGHLSRPECSRTSGSIFARSETVTFDPFFDFETRGYLRNIFGEKDPEIIRHPEHSSFIAGVDQAFERLAKVGQLWYRDVLETHKILFGTRTLGRVRTARKPRPTSRSAKALYSLRIPMTRRSQSITPCGWERIKK